jgi:glycosyltransferase involved in cell wall biosynthesis
MDQNQVISVIIPVYNSAEMLKQCLAAVSSSDYKTYECIVVDDSSTDDSTSIAREYGARIIELKGGPFGPAYARNRGVEAAQGTFIFFIDADVVIKPDTLRKIVRSFSDHPEYDALFGSYDDNPGDGQFLSIYKNLSHHFVHQQAQREGHTFWTGCGAIRKDVFLKLGGFDIHKYPRPSIEDIELGIRLREAGHRILVNKDIQVKHLKRWTLFNLLKIDVRDRGIPWTVLILHEQKLPNDLNLNQSQRLSAILLVLMLVDLGISALVASSIILLPLLFILFLAVVSSWHLYRGAAMFRMGKQAELLTYSTMMVIACLAIYLQHYDLLPPLALLLIVMLAGKFLPTGGIVLRHVLFILIVASLGIGFVLLFVSYPLITVLPILFCLAVILWLNRKYYYFFARLRGPIFALAVLPFQLFYYFYSLIAFGAGYTIHHARAWSRPGTKPQKQV